MCFTHLSGSFRLIPFICLAAENAPAAMSQLNQAKKNKQTNKRNNSRWIWNSANKSSESSISPPTQNRRRATGRKHKPADQTHTHTRTHTLTQTHAHTHDTSIQSPLLRDQHHVHTYPSKTPPKDLQIIKTTRFLLYLQLLGHTAAHAPPKWSGAD